MQNNLEKLMLIGFGIIVMSFGILSNAHAQSSVDPVGMSPRQIQSKQDYFVVENLIEDLAEKLYAINQMYPDFSYKHKYNQQIKRFTVSISGIDDQTLVDEISRDLIKLENLGATVRDMDPDHLPEVQMKESDRMNEKQTLRYTPQKLPAKK
jgi:hypothetical protein